MERIEFTNAKNERIIVDFTTTPHDKKNKKGLMNLWIKAGYIKEFIPETLDVSTYVYDDKGYCRGDYNPQINGHNKLNFDWVLANTEENKARIINEIKRRANA